MESRMQKVTTSAMRCFKSCRRRYYFEYVAQLKPQETPKALEIGTLYHAAVEMILAGRTENIRTSLLNQQQERCEERNIDFEPLNAEIAFEMSRAFARHSGYRNWDIRNIEMPFEVPLGYAKRLLGRIDGVIMREGKLYLIEHKTTGVWNGGEKYLHDLLWDEQPTNYLYAWNYLVSSGGISGLPPAEGVFYCIVEKPTIKKLLATPEANRKYTKDGKLYANQRETDETDGEYLARVREWYAAENRVHMSFVYRTPREIGERVADMNLVVKDMAAAERDGTFYRNPEACKIFPCAFRPKCLEDVPETDVLFMSKKTKHEELT